MKEFRLGVSAWSAWAPGIESSADWAAWSPEKGVPSETSVPAIPFVPASLRRRCSKLAKMMLYTALSVLDEESQADVTSVFATQGGESETTLALLEEIARSEVVSPLKFSLSVHNASAGLFSMAVKNRMASTTISAGNESFAAGLLESALQLDAAPDRGLLFVASDEWLPEVLCNQYISECVHYASSFYLTASEAEPSIIVRYESRNTNSHQLVHTAPQAFDFITWLLDDTRENFQLEAPTYVLQIEKSRAVNWSSSFKMKQ